MTTYVSAASRPAGLTVTVTMMLGAGYLPVIYLTSCTMAELIYGLPFAGFGYFEPLREPRDRARVTATAPRPSRLARGPARHPDRQPLRASLGF